jgi:ribonuclease/clavin/mitogillin
MEMITDGVWHTHAPGHTLPPYRGTECYWLGSDREVVLVDTGDGGEACRAALEADWASLGHPRVASILLTHRHGDHCGGAAWAQQMWGAPLLIHPDDIEAARAHAAGAELTPFSVGPLAAGGLEAEVLLAPGHTPGQLNLWLKERGLLLAGDNVLGRSTSVIVPPDGDMRAYDETLRLLESLSPRLIAPGHGPLVKNGVARLRYYRQHRQERERQVLALLREAPRAPREMAETIYRGVLGPENMRLGESMVRSHLAALKADGRVTAEPDGRYSLVP